MSKIVRTQVGDVPAHAPLPQSLELALSLGKVGESVFQQLIWSLCGALDQALNDEEKRLSQKLKMGPTGLQLLAGGFPLYQRLKECIAHTYAFKRAAKRHSCMSFACDASRVGFLGRSNYVFVLPDNTFGLGLPQATSGYLGWVPVHLLIQPCPS